METEIQNTRELLLELSEKGEIKYTVNYIKKASEKTLEKILQKYNYDQMNETRETLTNTIISLATEFAEKNNIISSAAVTGKKLENKKLFRRDLNNVVSHVVPFLPFLGFVEGALTFGKDAYDHWRRPPQKARSAKRNSV